MKEKEERYIIGCWWGRPSSGDIELPSTYVFDKIKPSIVEQIEFINETLNEVAEEGQIEQVHTISMQINENESRRKDIVYVRPYDNKIFIGESYLAYLWIMCYCAFSDFHELCYMRYTELGGSEKKLALNAEFRQFANRLFSRNEKWDLQKYPNPGLYHKYDSFEINGATSLFQHAILYIILHECSHVIHDHGVIDRENEQESVTRSNEYEADESACKLLVCGIEDKELIVSMQVGAVLGLLSILFMREELKDTDHPADHRRVKMLLESLRVEKTHYAWGFASILLQRLSRTTEAIVEPLSIGNMTFDTFKDQFDFVYGYIDQ